MKKKIINFVLDEKFIDGVIYTHDLYDDFIHEYVFINNNINYNFQYIKNFKRIRIIKYHDLKSIFEDKDTKCIFLHSLYSCPIKYIPNIPSEIKVFWFSWGYDIYERPLNKPLIPLHLYHYYTEIELKKLKYIPKKVISKINNIVKRVLYNGLFESKVYNKAINRIDYYSGVLSTEYDLVKSASDINALPVVYKYQIPKEGSCLNKLKYNGENILIGNSANCTNNHIDIFVKLSSLNINDRKIITPLSYGGFNKYAEAIIKKGKTLFDINFIPLISFIGKDEYGKIIDSCNIGIFLVERQQGIGNINMMLMRGCKVFLSETSVIYKYYKNIGIKVFSFQHELTQQNIDTPLSKEDQIRNMSILVMDRTKDASRSRFNIIYNNINNG